MRYFTVKSGLGYPATPDEDIGGGHRAPAGFSRGGSLVEKRQESPSEALPVFRLASPYHEHFPSRNP